MDSHSELMYVKENLSIKRKKNQRKIKDYIRINTLFRCFLSKEGNSEIANELRKRFKNSFHTFVLASLIANPDLQQKEAIENFIEHFHLTNNKVTYEMLKKSWDRSEEKESLVKKGRFPPIFY